MGMCMTCKFWVEINNTGEGECRVVPPAPLVLTTRTPLGQMQTSVLAFFPIIRKDLWCGAYATRLEGMN